MKSRVLILRIKYLALTTCVVHTDIFENHNVNEILKQKPVNLPENSLLSVYKCILGFIGKYVYPKKKIKYLYANEIIFRPQTPFLNFDRNYP